ncbi:MAG: desulfoferrodoxin [Clostridium sp.]
MTKLNYVYKCPICGNVVEVVVKAGGSLVCCGKPMVELVENTVDAAVEKHIPVVEKIEGGIRVKVGSVEHPMEEKHSIKWIEVIKGENVYRKNLNPGEKPEAEFSVEDADVVRAYCDLHGLWKA